MAASAGLHALVFAVMLRSSPEGRPLAPQPIVVSLTIEPRIDVSVARREARPKGDGPRWPSGDDVPDPTSRLEHRTRMNPPSATVQSPAGQGAQEALRQRIARSLRSGLSNCYGEVVDDEARLACETRLAAAADRARPINGSGDLRRDRDFARQGAAALAAYERRRDPLNVNDEVACVAVGPLEDCARVEVDLYSSSRGVLPNLRR